MSFTTRSTFSTNYRSVGSVRVPSYGARPVSSAASVYAGAGGYGSRISVSHCSSFRSGMGVGGLAAGMAGGLAGMGGIQNEKETMQSLNDRLASYLDRVRSLETENRKLESKIREHLEKKGPHVRDWGHYFKTIEDLRAQIFANTVDNARIVPQIDNARLAADDFRVKYGTEPAMCQSLESDINGLHKVIDDANVTRLQLETEIKALKEELLFMKKNHEEEESTIVVTTQSTEVEAAEMMLTELRCIVQSLEIDLDSMRNMKISLENSLRELEARYALQMEQLNGILLHLESELAQTWAEGQRQVQEYEALLNIKVKLEAKMATYRRLLEDGEDFSLSDALDSSNSMQTIQKTTTRWIVDGKVVSETNDTKVLRH
uniref:IF rod domain-containing protein n=1 Tax=Aotus nancymaae TaxID=37293 RepID=A0A2K5BWB8_AOTNA